MAKVLWASFALCTLAWLGLFAAPSTNTGNYAGYAVIGYLMLGVVPALTLLLALVGQFIARARVPLAVVSGLVTAGLAVTSAVTIVSGYAQVAERRRADERAAAMQAAVKALGSTELLAAARGADPTVNTGDALGELSWRLFDLLPGPASELGPGQRQWALDAMRELGAHGDTGMDALLGMADRAEPALGDELATQALAGYATREREWRYPSAVAVAREAPARIRRAMELVQYTRYEQGRAVAELALSGNDEGLKGALALLAAGFEANAGDMPQPLSQRFREAAGGGSARWPEADGEVPAASPLQRELYEALLAAEGADAGRQPR